jgi:hypothetical protein
MGATVRAVRRALLALGAAGVIAGALRLRGTGCTPPQAGGWRELSGPELG